jgi:uncharacterized protein (TIGR00369 family)
METSKVQSTFFEHIGFRRDETDPDAFNLELDLQPDLLQDDGTIHSGVFSTMLDIVMGATISKRFLSFATTINLNISFFNLNPYPSFRAETTILHHDNKSVTAEGVILNNEGDLIAKGMGTFKISPGSRQ